MSFSKTISIVAALASIFGAGAAGWKLAQEGNQQPKIYEERIQQLEEQLKQTQQPNLQVPQPTILPPTQTQVPQASQLPPPPPPVPPEQVTTSTP
jgi:type II secretory pathway pseudopilin PulG